MATPGQRDPCMVTGTSVACAGMPASAAAHAPGAARELRARRDGAVAQGAPDQDAAGRVRQRRVQPHPAHLPPATAVLGLAPVAGRLGEGLLHLNLSLLHIILRLC
jgi:hypothetical protein